jgi:DNA-binding NtrC family response regulator
MKISHISIIDDDPGSLLLMKEILGDHFETATFQDAGSFFKKFNKMNTDLVVTDLMLPDTTGFEIIKMIRTEVPDMPVILVSATDDERVIKKAYQMGITAYFRKPLNYGLFQDTMLHSSLHN